MDAQKSIDEGISQLQHLAIDAGEYYSWRSASPGREVRNYDDLQTHPVDHAPHSHIGSGVILASQVSRDTSQVTTRRQSTRFTVL